MQTIYIEGDSTTYGVLDTEMGGWAARMHVAMLQREVDFADVTIVENRATLGRTLPWILRETAGTMNFFRKIGNVAAVLQAGMNEVKIHPPSTQPVVPRRLFSQQVMRFCGIAREQDCLPILVGPPPIDTSRHNPTYSGAIIKDELLIEYGDTMRDVAQQNGAQYVDTRAVFAATGRPAQELLAPDGYHPNALGHAALFEAVYDALPRQFKELI